MANTLDMVDDYFSTNFYGREKWQAIQDEAIRASLLATAENDINAYLRLSVIDESCIKEEKPYTAYQMAVFEWALYIYSNRDIIDRATRDRTGGVSQIEVEGLGKKVFSGSAENAGDAYTSTIRKSPAGRFLRMISSDIRIVR